MAFEDIIDGVLKWEAGYQNNPKDKGNFYEGKLVGTNLGISAPTLAKYLGRTPTSEDMKNLTKEEAKKIYKTNYYDRYKIDQLPEDLKEVAMHSVVMSGNKGIKDIQQLIGVEDDGSIGPNTLKALEKQKISSTELKNAILGRYKGYDNWDEFGKGWTNRYNAIVPTQPSQRINPMEAQLQAAENEKAPLIPPFGAPKPREEVITERETVTEKGPGFYDRFTSGIKELLPFNKGGNVDEMTLNTIDIIEPDMYKNYMMQEAARRSMMQGNEEERMADYDYARDSAEDYPYLYPRRARSVTRPPMQAAQRMMGGFAQGGVVDQAQGLASLGRGGDSTLVHMQPREVAGLQQLAQANGTSLTRNPMTGMPEAFSLGGMFKSALPIAAGYFMGPGAAFGLEAGGTAALAAGAATGAGVAAATGDDPIMGAVSGGLGGMSGSGLKSAVANMPAATIPQAVPQTATNMIGGANLTTVGGMGSSLPPLTEQAAGISNFGMTPATMSQNVTPTSQGNFAERLFAGAKEASGTPAGPSGQTLNGVDIMNKAVAGTTPQALMKLGSPIASMGLGGLEESDFMVKPDFNDPRDKYDPRSRLDLNRDTGINEALSRDTGLRLLAKGGYLKGPGDGMSDDIPATINGEQPAALADGEFVVPADVVSHLGNGSSEAGSKQLYAMMDRIRKARTGKKSQGKEIKPGKYMPR